MRRAGAAAIAVLVLASGPLCSAAPLRQDGRLLVVSQGDRTLTVLNPETGQVLRTIPVGGVTGHEVTVLGDGRTVAVPIYGDSGVGKPGTDGSSVGFLDVDTGATTGRVVFPHGVRPHCARYDRQSGMLLVTTELDRTVSVIDPKRMRVVGAVPTGEPESHMLVLTRDGARGYTANVHSGTLSVLDVKGRKLLQVIPVSAEVQRIAMATDERKVFTSDQTQPRVAVLNTATNRLAEPIALPAIGYGLTPTPDGRWLLVALRTSGKVAVVDLQTQAVARVLEVPEQPTEILVQPDGKRAYVSCPAAGKIAVIDTGSWTVLGALDAGKGADGLAWVTARKGAR